jgi:hypothetical protein
VACVKLNVHVAPDNISLRIVLHCLAVISTPAKDYRDVSASRLWAAKPSASGPCYRAACNTLNMLYGLMQVLMFRVRKTYIDEEASIFHTLANFQKSISIAEKHVARLAIVHLLSAEPKSATSFI